eukprot:scaffold23551_cov15-Tisochrysis_lutea.AAC.1
MTNKRYFGGSSSPWSCEQWQSADAMAAWHLGLPQTAWEDRKCRASKRNKTLPAPSLMKFGQRILITSHGKAITQLRQQMQAGHQKDRENKQHLQKFKIKQGQYSHTILWCALLAVMPNALKNFFGCVLKHIPYILLAYAARSLAKCIQRGGDDATSRIKAIFYGETNGLQ